MGKNCEGEERILFVLTRAELPIVLSGFEPQLGSLRCVRLGKHFTLTVPLSTHMCKFARVNLMLTSNPVIPIHSIPCLLNGY